MFLISDQDSFQLSFSFTHLLSGLLSRAFIMPPTFLWSWPSLGSSFPRESHDEYQHSSSGDITSDISTVITRKASPDLLSTSDLPQLHLASAHGVADICITPLLLLTAELPAYRTNPYESFSAQPYTLSCITNDRSLFQSTNNCINHCHYRSKNPKNSKTLRTKALISHLKTNKKKKPIHIFLHFFLLLSGKCLNTTVRTKK